MPGDPSQSSSFASSLISGMNRKRPRRLTAAGQPRRKVKKAAPARPSGPPTSADDPRLAQYLSDPALRSKLPSSLLSKEQRAARERNADPYHKIIAALTREQFDPAEQQIKSQQRQSGVQEGRINDWFAQYQKAITDAQGRVAASQQQAVQNVQGMAQGFQQLAEGQGKAQADAMAADAAVRGATVDPAVMKAQQDAALQRRSLTDLSASTLVGQGVNNNANFEQALAASVGQKGMAMQDEMARRTTLEDELKSLMREKGAFKVKVREDLKSAEQKAALEAAAFGLDKAKVDASIRDQTQRRVITRQSQRDSVSQRAADRKSRESVAAANRRAADKRAASKKGKPTSGLGSRTAAQQKPYVSALNTLTSAMKKGTTRQQALRDPNPNMSPREYKTLVNAANDLARLGYLSPANVRALRAIGVNTKGFPRNKKSAQQQGSTPSQQVGDVLSQIGTTVARPSMMGTGDE